MPGLFPVVGRSESEARAKFEDAGLAIQIMKVDTINNMDDDVVDYNFRLAKALGARALFCGMSPLLAKAFAGLAFGETFEVTSTQQLSDALVRCGVGQKGRRA